MRKQRKAIILILILILIELPFINGYESVPATQQTEANKQPIYISEATYEKPVGLSRSFTKTTAEPTPTPEPTPEPTPTPAPKIDKAEYDLFCRIIALEGHPKYGYENYLQVATVIMNRVESDIYPDTITEVVSQKNQFSTYKTSRTPVYNESVYRAAEDALNGKRNLPEKIIAFITIEAYERNVRNGGWFRNLKEYERSNNTVWCYLP